MRDDHFLIVGEVVVTVAMVWLVAYITRRVTAATGGGRLAPVLAALVPLVGGIAAVIAALHG